MLHHVRSITRLRRTSALMASLGLVLAAPIGLGELPTGTEVVPGPVTEADTPIPPRPGNIFLEGDRVVIDPPPGDGDAWRVVDYEDRVVRRGRLRDGRAEIGPLPVGWYKLVRGGRGVITNRAFFCVLRPLAEPPPQDSPISMDVAMAWFFPQERQMRDVAGICRLAGINWVRDRLLWGELEPTRGAFADHSRYDVSARVQAEAGLRVLQVAHLSAPWANPNTRRFPEDLRDIHAFYREMARRWRGEVLAFEPWNEADIPVFGGHTGSEMATLQKAAYLGLKEGNPDVIGCLNVFAIRRPTTLSDFRDNEAWPYFDTYNLHHYEPLEHYPALYADHRATSAGRPLWVTECSVRVRWGGDEAVKDLLGPNLRLQGEQATKTYAMALHEGVRNVFYFVLPHYSERHLQYGLLRADLTPRPAFVAVATVGRMLAAATPRGRVDTDDAAIHGYLFATRSDGTPSNVLVIWADHETAFDLPAPPVACLDHLGRPHAPGQAAGRPGTITLGPAPLYLVLPNEGCPPTIPPPAPLPLAPGGPSTVVVQAVLPEEDTVVEESAHRCDRSGGRTIPMFVYNFGPEPVRGTLLATAPAGWTAEFDGPVDIQPGERKECTLRLAIDDDWTAATIRITGDFGVAGQPVLSFRLIPGT